MTQTGTYRSINNERWSLLFNERITDGEPARLAAGLEALALLEEPVSNQNSVDDIQASPASLRTFFLAFIVETTELLNELPWKPWKPNKVVDRKKVLKEFGDVLAFQGIIINQMKAMGFTTKELAGAFVDASRLNIARFNDQVEGYERGPDVGWSWADGEPVNDLGPKEARVHQGVPTRQDLDLLQDACDAATSGPWVAGTVGEDFHPWDHKYVDGTMLNPQGRNVLKYPIAADMRFIELAREWLPKLIGAAREGR